MTQHSYVALLRGINVGGRAKVSMEALRALFVDMGHTDVASYVQSGNIAFRTKSSDEAGLRTTLEKKISADLGVDAAVLIRSGRELATVLAKNPFSGRTDDPTKLHVTFLADRPAPALVAEIPTDRGGSDEFRVAGREIYLFCPRGYGETKLGNAFFEKRLATRATTRNWKTVAKLADMSS
jgi:uncharacterized protein (DUF1697 family)